MNSTSNGKTRGFRYNWLNNLLAIDWSKGRRLQREVVLSGVPAGIAEEAFPTPRGQRSQMWKSTAVLRRPKNKTNVHLRTFVLFYIFL
jgi:hypothetical protein